MTEKNQDTMNLFSQHLFWDVKRDRLDLDNNKEYIIRQVLEYGLMHDWRLIKSVYGIKTIADVAKKFRGLDKKTLSFIAAVSKEPIERFRCYTYQQSIPQHWNF